MIKAVVIIFLMMAGIAAVVPSYCQDDPEAWQIKTTQGSIVQIEVIGQLITVSTFDDQLTLFVPDSARIFRGTENISIDDLEISDNVTVKYYDAGVAGLKVVSIEDKNLGNE